MRVCVCLFVRVPVVQIKVIICTQLMGWIRMECSALARKICSPQSKLQALTQAAGPFLFHSRVPPATPQETRF